MKHRLSAVLIGGIAAIVFGQIASAADLPRKAPAYIPPPPPVLSWTGWYFGGNGGWVGSTGNTIGNSGSDNGPGGLGTLLAVGSIPTSVGLSEDGFIGGGQIGYNWQNQNWVLGFEADFAGVSAKADQAVGPISVIGYVPITTAYSRELNWLGTVRGRVGYLVAPSFLTYATGGFAFGETKLGNSFICPTCNPISSTQPGTSNNDSSTQTGWTIGAGAEWMFGPHMTAKVEYLYVDLGSHDSTITYDYVGYHSVMTSSVNERFNVVRVGINYKF